MFGLRKDRVSQQLQQEIADILLHELKDPRLGFVTITRVELSKDMRHAKVGYSCLGSEKERASSQEALDHGAGFIRSLVKKRLHMKIIPELLFRYDPSIEASIDISAKLDEIKAHDEKLREGDA